MSRTARLVLLVFLVAAVAVCGWYAYHTLAQPPGDGPTGDPAAPPPKPAGTGKLVVLVVFDQFRGDYLDRWASQFGPDGFARLKKDGVWYSNGRIPYACTSTAPGHASIATGVPPSVHGIVENDWFDVKAGKPTYCAEPAGGRVYNPVPPLDVPGPAGKPSRGSNNGFSPELLLAPTVGDALLAAHPDAKVVSVSIKDRTAAAMGGKRPTAAYYFDTRDGRFHTGEYYRPAAHPWVDAFNAGRPADRWLDARWTRLRPDLDYDKLAGPDEGPGESRGYFGQGIAFGKLGHPMHGTEPGPNPQNYAILECSPFGNDMLLAFTKAAVDGENLGNRGATDLLCVSFSSNDVVGHQWGPDSHEVLDLTLRSDRVVAELLAFLDAKLGADRYTLVVTADHGVCPLPEARLNTSVYRSTDGERRTITQLQEPLEQALDETFGKPGGEPVRWFEYVEWPWFYLNHKVLKDRGLAADDVAGYAAQWVGNRPYMFAGYSRKQIETGTPPPAAPEFEAGVRRVLGMVKLSYHPDRCGDVMAVPREYSLVTKYPAGTSHGSPHTYDAHVPVLVYGAGVPPLGKRDGRVSSLVMAPTLAWALGVNPGGMTEKVPAEIAGVGK